MTGKTQRKSTACMKGFCILALLFAFICFKPVVTHAGWAPLQFIPYQSSMSLYYGDDNYYLMDMGSRAKGASSVRITYNKTGIFTVSYGVDEEYMRFELIKGGTATATVSVVKNGKETKYQFTVKVLTGKVPNALNNFKFGTKDFASKYNSGPRANYFSYRCRPGNYNISIKLKSGWEIKKLWRQTWTGVSWLKNNKSMNTTSDEGVIGITVEQTKSKTVIVYMVCYEPNLPAPELKLSKTSATMIKGTTLQLNASRKNTTEGVKWSSSNKKVATVTSSGKVTAKANGTAVITASCDGVSAKCKITVKSLSKPSIGTIQAWNSGNTCKIKWGKIAGASGYEIQYQYKTRLSSKWVKKTKTVSKVECGITGITHPCQLKVKVRAYVVINGKKNFGPWCKEKTTKSQDYDKYGNAMRAYKDFLAKNSNITKFAIGFIDNDGIPELITVKAEKTAYSNYSDCVFSYKDGKIVTLVKENVVDQGTFNDQFDQYYSRTGIVRYKNDDLYFINYTYYQITGKTSKAVLSRMWADSLPADQQPTDPGFYGGLTKSQFESRLNLLTNGKSATTIKYYKNTAGNRKKVLS